ncbi:conserved domain protein [delta proteobacterium NaphS2]|nr:conserved domain protein [delta proteobacterium NaphS2]
MTSGFNEIELEENGVKIVILVFREKLTKEDYELFVPLTGATVRYFDSHEKEAAKEWLKEGAAKQ